MLLIELACRVMNTPCLPGKQGVFVCAASKAAGIVILRPTLPAVGL